MEIRKSASDPSGGGDETAELERPEAAHAELGVAIARDAAAVRDAVKAGTVPTTSGLKLSQLLDKLADELCQVAQPSASSAESASDIDARTEGE
ncbi:hypothetical protein [Amycolatopsis sp. NPDC004378]